jgi:signal transduction histidine kinase
LFKFYLLILFFLVSLGINAQNESFYAKLDSIESLRKLSNDSSLEMEVRLSYARNASLFSEELNIDSTRLKSNRYLSLVYLNMEEYNLYRDINHKNLKLALKLKDSVSIGIANNNLGWYHHVESQSDSSYYYYYNAAKIFQALGDKLSEGEALLSIADIQETVKDYISSEETAVRAISLVEQFPETERNRITLWSLYNLLGVISERLKNHDEAIENYNKCIEITKKMEEPLYYYLNSKNNVAFSNSQKGSLDKALNIYNEVLNDNRLFIIDPELYVLVLDNIAHTRFLSNDKDLKGIDNQFKKAYKISDSIQYQSGLISVMNDMSEFYSAIGKKDSALVLSKKAYRLAKDANSNNKVLKSLMALSKLEGGLNGKKYLEEYIKLNDSLLENERAIRNKFARVKFEVDKIEADNERLAKERLLFLSIAAVLLLSASLLYIVIAQRSKNRKLKFIQQQQETNEEIYNLMLAQQDKVEEGRTVEKKRISQELHDGILGRLFGTRLSLDSLNMVQTEEAVKTRSQYINELKTIETEIRKISHDLNADFISGSSFIDIIKTLIETQTKAYELEYTFEEDHDINWEDVPNKAKIHIYRMLQETMQNIYKHANANHIKISFQLKNNVILIAIEDDGSGFNVSKARKGIGLKNIDSRVRDVGGTAEVFSKIDIGTIIKITIPLD